MQRIFTLTLEKGFSDFLAGVPTTKSNLTTSIYHHYFLYLSRKLKLYILNDNGNELHNSSTNAACYQLHVAYILFVL